MYMRNVCWRALLTTLALASFLGSELRTRAQDVQVLLNWDATWRYNQNGTELGTGWKAVGFSDASWPSGQGIFAYEPDTPGLYTAHAPILTQLAVSTVVTSYYFRTTFQFSGTTAGLQLVASNLVDDGAVLWLNGSDAGRLRVTVANPNAATLASGGPAAEGTLEPIIITNLALLKQGANTMAVEVHQNASTSSDIAFGMKLMSIRATPLSITTQPQDQVATAGESVSLSVVVNGGPAVYRWYKVGSPNPITGAIAPTFTIASAQIGSAGQYYSVITNALGAVTSRVAQVTVLVDTEGPTVIDARGDTNTFASRGGAQAIAISFSEALTQLVSTNPANFKVYAGSNNFNNPVSFTNVVYNFSQLPRIYLFMTGPNWGIGSNYFVVINGVADAKGNTICPNTRVPVSWEVVTNLAAMEDVWEFHDASVFDPGIYSSNPPWYATNYQTSSSGWWGTGRGVLWYDPSSTGFTCPGTMLNKLISFQNQPTLFRRTFNIPTGLGSNGVLRVRFIADDGMYLYLNGKEVLAYNATAGAVINENTRARSAVEPSCITSNLTVANLKAGVNWLAAAVVQSSPEDQSDTTFGVEINGVFLKNSNMPSDPPPNQLVLTMSPGAAAARQSGQVQLSWPTGFGGYCLQYKTDLNPTQPWLTVSNQSNPFIGLLSDGPRLYRLAKP